MVNPEQTKNIRDMEENRRLALTALLTSLNEKSLQEKGKPMEPDMVQKLAERLSDVLLDNAGDGPAPLRNEAGQLVNEEGLPIMDIVESLPEPEDGPAQQSAITIEAALPLPMKYLGPDALERRKKETDRILDMLEREEELYLQREAQMAAAQSEAKNKDKAQKLEEEEERAGPEKKPASGKKKKSVSFAGAPLSEREEEEDVDWGDVIPARLKPRRKPAKEAQSPMTLKIIEHPPARAAASVSAPTGASRVSKPTPSRPVFASGADSDDEPSPAPSTSVSAPADQQEQESDMEEEAFDEGADMDEAMLQREVALEYYKRREALGAGPQAGALGGSAAMSDPNEWDQEDVPLEANLAAGRPKPATSRFMAARVRGTSNIPGGKSSAGNLLASAVKQGTLVNGHLVGGSDDEDEREIGADGQKILEELRAGVPPVRLQDLNREAPKLGEKNEVRAAKPSSSLSASPPVATASAAQPLPAPGTKKPSRFKASRAPAQSTSTRTITTPSAPSISQNPKPAVMPSNIVEIPWDFSSTIVSPPGAPPFPSAAPTAPATAPATAPSSSSLNPTHTPQAPPKINPDNPLMSPMLRDVKETKRGGAPRAPPSASQQPPAEPRKISRFKAGRMYGADES
ncbi:hypothetical protein BOTBODRAFT_185401 [Botryobasidium botryosum FD-172 SS1]|uniref:DUF3835 domain-containing protein n=1 Tax=Botryobasidium botryosum (strain FD-172 SS1) TaxID=930990 RepID=A0A067MTF9_BOTB1|nr:hypothetical protein BOTBODRAFT_185401 [Botryobasidium botryosum FD-172 SS1]